MCETITHWFYTDILTSQDCDKLINTYDQDGVLKLPPIIGEGVVDKSVRNVERVMLSVYKGLGSRLAAAGLDANRQTWKFDITHANQSEFLKYPADGRFKSHIDTALSTEGECRKLTVLAFLNDEFEGGKFFIQIGSEKYYPPQTKGTVLVFPSFLMHGVEDITKGTRYSAVCWMVGPFFR